MRSIHVLILAWAVVMTTQAFSMDPRDIATGSVISSEGYCDQPYIVVTKQGHWLCTMTTGPGEEGNDKQHVVSTISHDQGATWSPLVPIENQGPPESSWVMPLLVPSGRIYAFYVYNGVNMREVLNLDGKPIKRVDTLGHYVFKYSDDGGLTWSAERYRIPIRTFDIDRENTYKGEVQFFWGVGKPMLSGDRAYIGMSKVGGFGRTFIDLSEGFFLSSGNVQTENDPSKIVWETLPTGDIGLRAPVGPIAEEQNLVALSDGSLYCTYRTIDGNPCHAYSADGGNTWSAPEYMTYEPDGRRIKHPRAANFIRKFTNGKYLYWFHNHGGTTYEGRNPVWIAGGIERDGKLYWSQPEILLYDANPKTRMSYPDFVETPSSIYVTETQKSVARVHAIPQRILDAVWGQHEIKSVATGNLVVDEAPDGVSPTSAYEIADALPETGLPGITFDFSIDVSSLPTTPTNLFVSMLAQDVTALVVLRPDAGLNLTLMQRAIRQEITTQAGVLPSGEHHVSVILDAGPRVAMLVVDGQLLDGGTEQTQGWHRIQSDITTPTKGIKVRVFRNAEFFTTRFRFYSRPLLVSEAVGNWRASQ